MTVLRWGRATVVTSPPDGEWRRVRVCPECRQVVLVRKGSHAIEDAWFGGDGRWLSAPHSTPERKVPAEGRLAFDMCGACGALGIEPVELVARGRATSSFFVWWRGWEFRGEAPRTGLAGGLSISDPVLGPALTSLPASRMKVGSRWFFQGAPCVVVDIIADISGDVSEDVVIVFLESQGVRRGLVRHRWDKLLTTSSETDP